MGCQVIFGTGGRKIRSSSESGEKVRMKTFVDRDVDRDDNHCFNDNQDDRRFWRIVLLCSGMMILSPFGYLGCREMTLRDICLPGKKVLLRNNLITCKDIKTGKEWVRRID